jgi:hypothetical protein
MLLASRPKDVTKIALKVERPRTLLTREDFAHISDQSHQGALHEIQVKMFQTHIGVPDSAGQQRLSGSDTS